MAARADGSLVRRGSYGKEKGEGKEETKGRTGGKAKTEARGEGQETGREGQKAGGEGQEASNEAEGKGESSRQEEAGPGDDEALPRTRTRGSDFPAAPWPRLRSRKSNPLSASGPSRRGPGGDRVLLWCRPPFVPSEEGWTPSVSPGGAPGAFRLGRLPRSFLSLLFADFSFLLGRVPTPVLECGFYDDAGREELCIRNFSSSPDRSGGR